MGGRMGGRMKWKECKQNIKQWRRGDKKKILG